MGDAPTACTICGERFERMSGNCPHDGAPLGRAAAHLLQDPFPGRVVLDEYELGKLMGYGAMGRVYRCHHRRKGGDFAAKILHAHLANNAPVVRRFEREARLAQQLHHPNIVEVVAHGDTQDPTAPARLPVLVMEYLDGRSLRSCLANGSGPLVLREALDLCRQICLAVACAHELGIVHRDIKPANILLLSRRPLPLVKVLDFGLAKSTREEGSQLTNKGTVLGTPHYISPEAALGEPVSPASDVYSIATVLYECLLGRPPFCDNNPIAVLVHHTSTAPARLDRVSGCQPLPQRLVELIDENLAKRPQDRLPDAGALLKALDTAVPC